MVISTRGSEHRKIQTTRLDATQPINNTSSILIVRLCWWIWPAHTQAEIRNQVICYCNHTYHLCQYMTRCSSQHMGENTSAKDRMCSSLVATSSQTRETDDLALHPRTLHQALWQFNLSQTPSILAVMPPWCIRNHIHCCKQETHHGNRVALSR